MQVEKIDYEKVSAISSKDLSYIKLEPFLREFYAYTPELESFADAVRDREKYPVDRELLTTELRSQYTAIGTSSAQAQNIEALGNNNTFTIITAHQPSLFGGPLYYVLKMSSVINLCKTLNKKYPDYHFVPTFVSGGEDHDFEEINHLHLFGKTVSWQRESSGPVGRLDTSGLQTAIDEVRDILGDHPIANRCIEILQNSLATNGTYSDFVFSMVNQLFADYGLLVVNMDNRAFKGKFAPIMKRELTERISRPHVLATQEKLDTYNFKAQAFPRDINLFYVGDGSRDRIEYVDGRYTVVDSDKSFSEVEILSELDNHPEHFSPNVVMRPMYQETILPNLAYVGGGGEIAYWLERKTQFEAFGIFYPMLIRRNSAMMLNKGLEKTISGLDFDIDDIFATEDMMINKFISEHTEVEVSLENEKGEIQKSYEQIADKSKQIDPSLAKAVLAEMTKQLKSIDQMESRMKRTLKSRQEVNINKISKLKEKLFPNNGLQERYDNFMPHYMSVGETFFDDLIEHLDPMDRRFMILR